MRVTVGDVIRLTDNMELIDKSYVGRLATVVAIYLRNFKVWVDVRLVGDDIYQTLSVEDIKEIIM